MNTSTKRLPRAALAALVWSVSTATLWAQTGPVRTAAATTTEAAADNLTRVLTSWTSTAEQIRTLSCKFVRSEFDAEHQTETRGQGTINYELDGRAAYVLEPVPRQPNLRSSRANQRGVPYQLAFPKSETFYWISGQIARINPERMEYELFEVPEQFQTTGVVETVDSFDILWTRLGCLERQVPGLIETDIEDLQARYTWSLESLTERQIVLKAIPQDDAEKRHCSMLVIYLDPKSYFVQGTKTFDPTSSKETMHVFSEMKVNAVPASNTPDWAPNIGQMNLLTPPPLAPPADE